MADRSSLDNVVVQLPSEQMTHYLRVINRVLPEQAKSIADISLENLTRVKSKRDMSKAQVVPFDGALDVDIGTLLSWMKRVRRLTRAAKAQLVILDASAALRAGIKE